jgi:hypothetical protein
MAAHVLLMFGARAKVDRAADLPNIPWRCWISSSDQIDQMGRPTHYQCTQVTTLLNHCVSPQAIHSPSHKLSSLFLPLSLSAWRQIDTSWWATPSLEAASPNLLIEGASTELLLILQGLLSQPCSSSSTLPPPSCCCSSTWVLLPQLAVCSSLRPPPHRVLL